MTLCIAQACGIHRRLSWIFGATCERGLDRANILRAGTTCFSFPNLVTIAAV